MEKGLIRKFESPFDLFEDVVSSMVRPSAFSSPQWSGGNAGWAPQVDVRETDAEIVIRAALPGVKKEDIGLEVKDGRLVLSGGTKHEVKDEGRGWVRREISTGTFYRAFQLPSGMRTDAISAKHEDGVLEIRVPKPEEAKPRQIGIS